MQYPTPQRTRAQDPAESTQEMLSLRGSFTHQLQYKVGLRTTML